MNTFMDGWRERGREIKRKREKEEVAATMTECLRKGRALVLRFATSYPPSPADSNAWLGEVAKVMEDK